MIDVRIGTTTALETLEEAEGNQTVVKAEGERTISFLMPDGVSAMDASSQVIGALNGVMMEVGSTPWWIESNDQSVTSNLMSHYGVDLNQMPAAWGDGTTSATPGPAKMTQQVTGPPPDPQAPAAPVLPPEEEAATLQSQPGAQPPPVQAEQMSVEPEPEVEVVQQTPTTRTTRTRKKAAAPEPQPEGEVDDKPAPEPEPQPEGDA